MSTDWSRTAPLVLLTFFLGACASTPVEDSERPTRPDGGFPSDQWGGQDGPPDSYPVDIGTVPDAVPRTEPRSTRGNPPFYEVAGQRYLVLDSAIGYEERGIASWYGTKFHGRETSSGEPYDMFQMTAAHKHLPLPTFARVTNLENGRSVVVRINDRGPFIANRLIDLSYAAAVRLDIVGTGTGLVDVRALPHGDAEMPDVSDTGTPVAENPDIFVQVGAFSSLENAERVATRLRLVNLYNVNLYTRENESPQLWRVRIGPLNGVAEVDRVMERVIRAGFNDSRIVID